MSSDIVMQLRAWQELVASGYEVPAAGRTMREAADRIEALEGEVAALKANPDKAAGRYAVEQIRRAEAAEARAERLRVALEKLKAHPSIGAIVFTEQHVASGQPSVVATSALYVINKAIEDDKQ